MKATIKRTKLKDDAIVTLFYELDVDFIKRIEENVEITSYSKKLAENANFIIAIKDNGTVACLAYYINQIKSEIYIPYICVGVEYRGLGLGEMMLSDVCNYADQESMSISLEVLENNNRAIALYKKFGFKECHLNNGTDKIYMTRLVKM